jgi:hypothetical protein
MPATAATGQDIDAQRGTLALQTSSGKTIDLQVSQELLSTLQEGDRVEVTMREASPSSAEQAREAVLPCVDPGRFIPAVHNALQGWSERS